MAPGRDQNDQLRMSGPPKVGNGELSRMASENNPSAPRCRNTAKIVRCRGELWNRRFSIHLHKSANYRPCFVKRRYSETGFNIHRWLTLPLQLTVWILSPSLKASLGRSIQ
jgi:hypothetical protein